MAISIVYDVSVTINSVDLSDHVKSATITYEAEMQDATRMGNTTRVMKPGIKNWSATVELEQDYAGGSVDATLFALIGAAAFPVIIRPTSAARGAANPEFTGSAVLENYNPIAGTVGDLAVCTASLRSAGVLGRSVTP